MSIANNIEAINNSLKNSHCRLVAVSKTYPAEAISEAYEAGQRIFGENKVQELVQKYEVLPKDINWHLIGHLQTNKVKFIAPFVSLIHSVDSLKLLNEINKEGAKNNRVIDILLQLYIADEETKFGFSFEEVEAILTSEVLELFDNIKIVGFMGMATNTDDQAKIRLEFRSLKLFSDKCKSLYTAVNVDLHELSMGMSSDYKIAIEEGSSFVRIGSSIFGRRN
ncbi:MAG TPA: YggS family pyridoxal phosphate-dependent enzyme [Cytophagaceae bacterium]|jgi:pyridoxal phosphate enzyme (YggS family)|nr:YggS family pyridoxal phosphate-dependent enzyme [Cytophagaceae bacterium]